ncbi:MAG: proline--tRNA ligase, partial [Bacillota bacterium]
MVRSEIGENTIAYCDSCGYAANDEKAKCINKPEDVNEAMLELEKVYTPNMKTIEEITGFLKCSPKQVVKTLLYLADNKLTAALVRGDRDLNEAKLKNILGCTLLEMAAPDIVAEATNANVGFAGPMGLKNIKLVVDEEVSFMKNFVVGANETDYHYINVNLQRDFVASTTADIRNIAESDCCPACGGPIALTPGIEVGHIFKLGTKYSKALNCVYVDEKGQEIPMVMGSYGIGLNRTIATVIEQYNDENGIIWPVSLAPYHVIVIPANMGDTTQASLAEEIYRRLLELGIEVLLDDRDERTGVKFKDADLIGIPVRITVGRKSSEAIVEVKNRNESTASEMDFEAAIEHCKKLLEAI